MKLTIRYSLLRSRTDYGRVSFYFPYIRITSKTMSDVLYRAIKYMNAEDALVASEEKPKKRERQEESR